MQRLLGTCLMLSQKASLVCPLRVRPLRSTMVPLMSTGMRVPLSSKNRSSAKIAAFAFSVSKMVSTRNRSEPPSHSASA